MSAVVEFVRIGCDFCGRAANWLCYPCRSPLCDGHKKDGHNCLLASWDFDGKLATERARAEKAEGELAQAREREEKRPFTQAWVDKRFSEWTMEHSILRARAEKAEQERDAAAKRAGWIESEHAQHVKTLSERLARIGFTPGKLQEKWRVQKGLKYDYSEVDAAILDALVNMGGATAWGGDGSSCAAQIVENICQERDAAVAARDAAREALRRRLHPNEMDESGACSCASCVEIRATLAEPQPPPSPAPICGATTSGKEIPREQYKCGLPKGHAGWHIHRHADGSCAEWSDASAGDLPSPAPLAPHSEGAGGERCEAWIQPPHGVGAECFNPLPCAAHPSGSEK